MPQKKGISAKRAAQLRLNLTRPPPPPIAPPPPPPRLPLAPSPSPGPTYIVLGDSDDDCADDCAQPGWEDDHSEEELWDAEEDGEESLDGTMVMSFPPVVLRPPTARESRTRGNSRSSTFAKAKRKRDE